MMPWPLQMLAASLTIAWAGVSVVLTALALARRRTVGAPRRPFDVSGVRVLMVRPCAGLEPRLLASLWSAAELRRSCNLRIVLTVARLDDPAREVTDVAARTLRAAGHDVEARVSVAAGLNQKVAQLAAVVDPALGDHDVILVADSDVDLTGLDLDALVTPLLGPDRIAAVWLPPVERAPTTWGDRASAGILGGSLHAFTLLGAIDRHGLVGKAFAVRSDALDQVGGFGALVDVLGEDMELAARLRHARWRCQMSSLTVPSQASGRSWPSVVERYTRWLMVIRSQRPLALLAYPLLLAGFPIALGIASGLALADAPWAFAVVIAVGVRLWVARVAATVSGRKVALHDLAVQALLADVTLWVAFVGALLRRKIRWRARTLVLGKRGRLVG